MWGAHQGLSVNNNVVEVNKVSRRSRMSSWYNLTKCFSRWTINYSHIPIECVPFMWCGRCKISVKFGRFPLLISWAQRAGRKWRSDVTTGKVLLFGTRSFEVFTHSVNKFKDPPAYYRFPGHSFKITSIFGN